MGFDALFSFSYFLFSLPVNELHRCKEYVVPVASGCGEGTVLTPYQLVDVLRVSLAVSYGTGYADVVRLV